MCVPKTAESENADRSSEDPLVLQPARDALSGDSAGGHLQQAIGASTSTQTYGKNHQVDNQNQPPFSSSSQTETRILSGSMAIADMY